MYLLPASVRLELSGFLNPRFETPVQIYHYTADDDETTGDPFTLGGTFNGTLSPLTGGPGQVVVAAQAQDRAYSLLAFSLAVSREGPTEPWFGTEDKLLINGYDYFVEKSVDPMTFELDRACVLWRNITGAA